MSRNVADEVVGKKVTNRRGERLGKVARALYQGDRDEPDWLEIKLGWLGLRKQIIPLEHVHDVDGHLEAIEEREWLIDAPAVALDRDRMTDEEADQLRAHYGLERVVDVTTSDIDIDLPRETRDAHPPSLEEEPGNPITERRRERARELGIPSAQEPAERE